MASVALRFSSPGSEDLVQLHIFESVIAEGPFLLIETVTDIGSFPDYIDHYTTEAANSTQNWFAIQWEDARGAKTDISAAIQGNAETLVAQIVYRVRLLDPMLKESLVIQNVEDVVGEYYNVDDPMSVSPLRAKYKIKAGLTLMAMARYRLQTLSNSTTGWTAGLVSMKASDSTQTITAVKEMMKQADRLLGIGYARIAQMVIPDVNSGLSCVTHSDISRLLFEVDA